MKRILIGLVVGASLSFACISALADLKKPVAAPLALYSASCSTAGAVEFPSGMSITNIGKLTLKKGRRIQWTFTNGPHGTHTLGADLSPGKSVFKDGVNPAAGTPCKAKILPQAP